MDSRACVWRLNNTGWTSSDTLAGRFHKANAFISHVHWRAELIKRNRKVEDPLKKNDEDKSKSDGRVRFV